MTILHEIEKLMDPHLNYQTYREIESKRKEQQLIPFLGLYLKDLTFANDGNAKMLPNGLVNFTKAWGVFDIIERAYQFQLIAPSIQEEPPAYEYCKKLTALPEKRLYKYSLLAEPREAPSESGSSSTSAAMRLIEKWTGGGK